MILLTLQRLLKTKSPIKWVIFEGKVSRFFSQIFIMLGLAPRLKKQASYSQAFYIVVANRFHSLSMGYL